MKEILIEVLKVSAPIIAAFVGGVFMLLLHRHQKMRLMLLNAYQDIQFLQAVENVHVEMNIGRGGKSNKVFVRNLVRKEKGLNLSGIRPSQVERRIEQFQRRFTLM